MGLAFLFICQRVCVVIYIFFRVFSLFFMLYVGSCVVYYVTFLILINIALRLCCCYGGDFSVAYLYLPIVAYIVICES
jgi:hypothetical protein